MAVLNITGFETGDTAEVATSGFAGTGASAVAVSTSVRSGSGSYSLKTSCATSNDNASWGWIKGIAADGTHTDLAAATSYVRFYVRFETIPSSSREMFFAAISNAATQKSGLAINSTGTISVYQGYPSTTVISTTTAVFALDTWYRVEFMSTTSASSSPYEARFYSESGVLLDTLSGNKTQLNDPFGGSIFGKSFNTATRAMVAYFDDYAVSDSDWVGPGACIRLAPTANGSTMQWTAGTNSSDYQEVDEAPTDSDTTYIQSTGSANDLALFSFQNPVSLGIMGTVTAAKLTATTKENTSVTSATLLRLVSNGSNLDGSTFNGSTSYSRRFLLSITDPATSEAWSVSALGTVQGGVKENNAVAVRCSNVGLFIDYNAANFSRSNINIAIVGSRRRRRL